MPEHDNNIFQVQKEYIFTYRIPYLYPEKNYYLFESVKTHISTKTQKVYHLQAFLKKKKV